MLPVIGEAIEDLDTPQLLLDLDIVDANLRRMFDGGKQRGVAVRTHFKSLKCGGLASYIQAHGGDTFMCAKLNEAEVLADTGITDILLANEIVNSRKMQRLADLADRVNMRVCVDQADNVRQLSEAMRGAGATLGVLVEVDLGMARCGVPPGEAAVPLARQIHQSPGLRFDGLQGYAGQPAASHRSRAAASPFERRHRTADPHPPARRRGGAARGHRHRRGHRHLGVLRRA